MQQARPVCTVETGNYSENLHKRDRNQLTADSSLQSPVSRNLESNHPKGMDMEC